MSDDANEEVVPLVVDGILDLHTFHPRDVPGLLDAYFDECLRLAIYEVRLIHGKGTGQLRRRVRAICERDPRIATVRTGLEWEGGWGATVVTLRAPAS